MSTGDVNEAGHILAIVAGQLHFVGRGVLLVSKAQAYDASSFGWKAETTPAVKDYATGELLYRIRKGR